MIDHIGIRVKDLAKAKAFYVKALAPLGYVVVMEFGPEAGIGYEGIGFGAGGKPDFWVGRSDAPCAPIHVAFQVGERRVVEAFHEAALKAGGRDNGPAGERPHYHPGYYGAFVLDPEGNNVEAVCHK
jgi:catechol 2,3-dioxygenase-like lactoylglutathione lyase family enzyme